MTLNNSSYPNKIVYTRTAGHNKTQATLQNTEWLGLVVTRKYLKHPIFRS